MKAYFLLLVLACGCSHRSERPAHISVAQKLMGQNLGAVETSLGSANDRDANGRNFWFLSTDSLNNPSPTPRLYEFIFQNDRLFKIEPVRTGPNSH